MWLQISPAITQHRTPWWKTCRRSLAGHMGLRPWMMDCREMSYATAITLRLAWFQGIGIATSHSLKMCPNRKHWIKWEVLPSSDPLSIPLLMSKSFDHVVGSMPKIDRERIVVAVNWHPPGNQQKSNHPYMTPSSAHIWMSICNTESACEQPPLPPNHLWKLRRPSSSRVQMVVQLLQKPGNPEGTGFLESLSLGSIRSSVYQQCTQPTSLLHHEFCAWLPWHPSPE